MRPDLRARSRLEISSSQPGRFSFLDGSGKEQLWSGRLASPAREWPARQLRHPRTGVSTSGSFSDDRPRRPPRGWAHQPSRDPTESTRRPKLDTAILESDGLPLHCVSLQDATEGRSPTEKRWKSDQSTELAISADEVRSAVATGD